MSGETRMPEGAETKILRLEQRVDTLESHLEAKLDSVLTVVTDVKTTLAAFSARNENYSSRLDSQGQRLIGLEERTRDIELKASGAGPILQATIFLAGAIVTGVIAYLVTHA